MTKTSTYHRLLLSNCRRNEEEEEEEEEEGEGIRVSQKTPFAFVHWFLRLFLTLLLCFCFLSFFFKGNILSLLIPPESYINARRPDFHPKVTTPEGQT